MNQKFNNGITLIALVITIIVLLILAGVTISMVLGDDGIIGQAQNAKTAQEKAEEKEQEEIQKGQGNIDLYTAGTVASTVKVGDYVEYNYTAPTNGYTTPATTTEDYVNSETQTFSSSTGGNAVVSKWRVLSKKDGIIKLVAETPVSSTLTLSGANGWVNGPKVLDEMCKTLYSSSIGTARSINVDDVNEITGYEVPEVLTQAAINVSYEYMEIAYGTTIAEVAKTAGSGGTEYNMSKFAGETPEEGKDIGDYELTHYVYTGASQMGTTYDNGTDNYKMLFRKLNNSGYLPYYWLASTSVYVSYGERTAGFGVRCVTSGRVTSFRVYDYVANSGSPAYAVRPVVTLKSGLEIRGGTGESDSPWQIKGN